MPQTNPWAIVSLCASLLGWCGLFGIGGLIGIITGTTPAERQESARALAERGWDRRFSSAALAMLAGHAVIYLFGVTWLAAFVGWDRTLAAGLLPFLPGDAAKLLLAAAALPGAWKLIGAASGAPGAGTPRTS